MAQTEEEKKQKRQDYYQANREKILANVKTRAEENKEGIAEYKKQYFNKNKARIYAERRVYAYENSEKVAEYKRQYVAKYPDRVAKSKKDHRDANMDSIKASAKARYEATKILKRPDGWEHRTPEQIKAYKKQWATANKERLNLAMQERLSRDPLLACKERIRGALRSSFRRGGCKKPTRTHEILGCSFEQFKVHIESKFEPGMSWERRSEFHLDHIIPISTAKTVEDLVRLNHYSNFQPLWAFDNLSKGAKLNWSKG